MEDRNGESEEFDDEQDETFDPTEAVSWPISSFSRLFKV